MALILSGDTGPSFVQSAAQPTGSVLQVVNSTYSTNVTTSSTSPVATGLTATITPKFATSKIMVVANISGSYNQANNSAGSSFFIYKNGSNLLGSFYTFTNYLGSATALIMSVPINYLDSPATTSATTYAIYFCRGSGSGSVVVQQNNDVSTIQLLEIAA